MNRLWAPLTWTLWVLLTLAYPAVVYYGSSHWPPHVLSLALLALLAALMLARRLSQAGSKTPANTSANTSADTSDWRTSALPVIAGVLLLLGAVLRQGVFIKFVPIVVSGGLLALFGLSLRTPHSLVERFARRQDPNLTPDKVAYCRTVTIVWCVFFVGNIAMTIALAMFAPLAWWTFYTGVVAYVLIGTLSTVEFIVRKSKFRDYSDQPWLHERALAWVFPPRAADTQRKGAQVEHRPNDLVEVDHERSTWEHRFTLSVPKDLPVFAGHFPGAPLLPAFCELGEIVRRVHRCWPDLGPWQGASSMKFKAPIEPGNNIELWLRRKPDSGAVTFKISGPSGATTADTTYAQGNLKFAQGVQP